MTLELNTIIQGDCMEVMKNIPDKSIDLVLTDPPYGMNKGSWDKDSFYPIMEISKKLKDDGAIYLFCGDNNYIHARTEAEKYFNFHRTIIWEKENIYGGGDYLLAHEYILYLKKGSPVFNNIGRPSTSNANLSAGKLVSKEKSVWKSRGFNNTCKEYVGHPTQKPVQIIKKIIENSSNEGQTILDPFSGSGTTAIACHDLKRNFICIEKEPSYVEISRKRLEEARMQLSLF